MEKPKRRYELTITAGADDLPYLLNMLQEQVYSLQKWPDNLPYSGFSGGYSGNHSVELKVRPETTHDSYFAELEVYLRKEPGEANHEPE